MINDSGLCHRHERDVKIIHLFSQKLSIWRGVKMRAGRPTNFVAMSCEFVVKCEQLADSNLRLNEICELLANSQTTYSQLTNLQIWDTLLWTNDDSNFLITS